MLRLISTIALVLGLLATAEPLPRDLSNQPPAIPGQSKDVSDPPSPHPLPPPPSTGPGDNTGPPPPPPQKKPKGKGNPKPVVCSKTAASTTPVAVFVVSITETRFSDPRFGIDSLNHRPEPVLKDVSPNGIESLGPETCQTPPPTPPPHGKKGPEKRPDRISPAPAAPFRLRRDSVILTAEMWNKHLNLEEEKTTAYLNHAQRLSMSTLQNGLGLASSATPTCSQMIIIFARGTLEQGNVGKLTGPPFFAEVAAQLGNADYLSVQGVDYPATIPDFLSGGSSDGSTQMAHLVNQVTTYCPSSKLVLAGYSQGAQLVHKATAMLAPSTLAAISSIVLFGDPNNGTAVAGTPTGNVLSICHAGDDICAQGLQIRPEHLNYSMDVGAVAAFVVARSRLGIGVGVRFVDGMRAY